VTTTWIAIGLVLLGCVTGTLLALAILSLAELGADDYPNDYDHDIEGGADK
jgi:hypothetical protein